ncbi:heat shock 22 kDa protein, mitochondrial-like [Lotus japonicus]|uniref:heat shock 22 kDa protein, mitochondrial-like n=1 Tax=Lotus japonicus TaxID=34305 RepID=UPI002583ADE2|nr:heat shock 22 kDa protein, mitochondrial-like [Lotus japonicus]
MQELGYWVQGFRCFPWLAVSFFLKDGLNVAPSTLQLLQNSANLPMVGTPLYAVVSDSVYISGQHRVPYIAIGDVYDPFSPTRSLFQVLNTVDQLMNSPFITPPTRSLSQVLNTVDQLKNNPRGARNGWDARETEDALLLRVNMPGLGKEDVKIAVEQNTLTIRGEGPKESEEEVGGGLRYTSRIDLPDKLYKIDQIKAEMKNGVLKVTVPKMKEEERSDVFNVTVD